MTNEAALDAFLEQKAKIDALLAEIQNASDHHFDALPESVDWGHVGNLGHIAEVLGEAARFC